jgi:long-subunit fatty acid transport protein
LRFSHILSFSILLACQQVFALDGEFSSTLGVDYSSGDYGASKDTDVWAIPMSLKYRTDTWNVRVSTSYLRVTSPSFVTPEGDFIGSGNALTVKRVTEEGIGDVNIAGTYNLLDDRKYPVGLDVSAKVKIPTADEDKFLGTGKTDFGLNAEIFKSFGDWSPYWNVGFKWRGDPKDFNLKNVWSSSFGTDYRINDSFNVGVGYDWQQKTTKFSDNAQEASTYVNYKINGNNKLNFYLLTGFSNASPNFGSGLVLIHYF